MWSRVRSVNMAIVEEIKEIRRHNVNQRNIEIHGGAILIIHGILTQRRLQGATVVWHLWDMPRWDIFKHCCDVLYAHLISTIFPVLRKPTRETHLSSSLNTWHTTWMLYILIPRWILERSLHIQSRPNSCPRAWGSREWRRVNTRHTRWRTWL